MKEVRCIATVPTFGFQHDVPEPGDQNIECQGQNPAGYALPADYLRDKASDRDLRGEIDSARLDFLRLACASAADVLAFEDGYNQTMPAKRGNQ